MTAASILTDPLSFDLPEELIATEPIEMTGLSRDDVRLLVAWRGRGDLVGTRFRRLAHFLHPGDLVVVNTSGTLPAALPARLPAAALPARLPARSPIESPGAHPAGAGADDDLLVHLSTELADGSWVVELRRACGAGSRPFSEGRAGSVLDLPDRGRVELLAPYPAGDDASTYVSRLWRARLTLPEPLTQYLGRAGRPIRYGCPGSPVPISAYQTVFAAEAGSAEMPSAGRPFTVELVTELVTRGVGLAPIVLHTGVSSQEAGEPPYPERFRVPAETAARVNLARDSGHRVIAVGTTVTRALESAVDASGRARAAQGWTELIVTPESGVRVVDGLLTGWHEPRATHLALLEAVAGRPLVERSYAAALAGRYRWHEFGDLHLVLP